MSFYSKCHFYKLINKSSFRFYSRKPKSKLKRSDLENAYNKAKEKLYCLQEPPDIREDAIFVCNELDLKDIKAYGFDYDYTIAQYKPSIQTLLYDLGKRNLISMYKYPEDALSTPYSDDFPIRGLHFDIEKGLLLKLDSFTQISFSAVFKGRKKLKKEETLHIYKNRIIPIGTVEGKAMRFYQISDMFSKPEIALVCNIIQYFDDNKINYKPELVYDDVKECIGMAHGQMHKIVSKHVEEYIENNKKLRKLFELMKSEGKKIFIVTNSGFPFVNNGMNWLIGKDWRYLFDLVICQAGKPLFFTDTSRALRVYDEKQNIHLWEKVKSLNKNMIYTKGNVKLINDMTGWKPREVLYFGDHPSSDLAELTLEHGWRTAAIVHELIDEIRAINRQDFKRESQWMQILTELLNINRDYSDDDQHIIHKWIEERLGAKDFLKEAVNPYFGSLFRTYQNKTLFSRRLFRFCDIYTTRLSNLLNYSLYHHFLPKRELMPHEFKYNLFFSDKVLKLKGLKSLKA